MSREFPAAQPVLHDRPPDKAKEEERPPRGVAYLGSHVTRGDFEQFAPFLAGADDLYLEAVGWGSEDQNRFSLAVEGQGTPSYFEGATFLDSLREYLADHAAERRRSVHLFDLRANDPVYEKIILADRGINDAVFCLGTGQYERSLQEIRLFVQAFATCAAQREHLMYERLSRYLLKRTDRTFCIFLGKTHKGVVERLKQNAIEDLRIEEAPAELSAREEAVSRMQTNQDVDDTLLSRVLTEPMLFETVGKNLKKGNKGQEPTNTELLRIVNMVTRSISTDEYKELSGLLGQASRQAIDQHSARKEASKEFFSKHIRCADREMRNLMLALLQ